MKNGIEEEMGSRRNNRDDVHDMAGRGKVETSVTARARSSNFCWDHAKRLLLITW